MKLTGLFDILSSDPVFSRVWDALAKSQPVEGAPDPGAAKPFLIAALHVRLAAPTVVLVPRPEDAQQLYAQLQLWLGEEFPVYLYPESDALPYERLAAEPSTSHQRMRALAALAGVSLQEGMGKPLIVASALAASQKTLSPSAFAACVVNLSKGNMFPIERVLERAVWAGYRAEPGVEVPGVVSRRGGIVDFYSPHYHLPVRVEFFGDSIESIRYFDPMSQRSAELAKEATLIPCREMILPRDASDRERAISMLDLRGCSPDHQARLREELDHLLQAQPFDGDEFYSALFNGSSLLDHLPPGGALILDGVESIESAWRGFHQQAEELRSQKVQLGELPSNFPVPYLMWEEVESRIQAIRRLLTFSPWGVRADVEASEWEFKIAPSYGGRLRALANDLKKAVSVGKAVVITSQQALRLAEVFREVELFISPQQELLAPPPAGSITLIQGTVAEGWTLPSKEGETWLLTDAEVFGFTKQRRLVRRRPVRREAFLSQLAVGDYVVHIEHGIGRFAGVIKLAQESAAREYLVLEYAEGDKLYVPTEQIDRVALYVGTKEGPPTLTRLGTQEWTHTKQKVKESALKLAQELLELYASREVAKGVAFPPDTAWQQELEVSFPYVETDDQLATIQQVKEDMEKTKPMDRLVCGDVGYGKTEVAVRAAFKAVTAGMQVAVLVPTTVLAEQHFETFKERMAAFPVRAEVLSRFRTGKEQRSILQGVSDGSIDICIGTHRLLQRDVSFKNLGLVIIDEEQRFGVNHKERLKRMRSEVDVLTLSATPIPRTLYMSLTGIRDMSTMETPPEERLPIKTYVAEFDERIVREAILRELERGGQVFFVHNRVQNIEFIAEKVRRIVPEAEVSIAHGQMPEEQLEEAMLEFARATSDVLVCTTIIESGLDMPNVNTLIVNDADKFGLSQLYQLRGRVGRAAARAYAYFLFDPGKPLTPTAEKRLKTILAATELGAGFRIALQDLEIRGAGNVLGAEQSGHISAVGFDLYCRLLAEAVEELKAEQAGKGPRPMPGTALERGKETTPVIDIPLPAHIPEDYVEDVAARLLLYQRLVKMKEAENLSDMAAELEDRFGSLPEELENLLYLVRLKLLAARAGVVAIAQDGDEISVRFKDKVPGIRLPESLRQHWDALKFGHSIVRIDTRPLGETWREALLGLLEEAASAMSVRA